MAILAQYHKPTSLPQAFELLSDPASRRVPLAGGAHLVGALETRQRRDIEGVVDLAGLGLSFIEQDGAYLHVGAMTTITDLIEHPLPAELAGGILPSTARYEGPLNLRNAATLGGLVALAEPDSETYAALLALNASVVTVDLNGQETISPLQEFADAWPAASQAPSLITGFRLPLGQAAAGHARIARTPMDRCIVAAVAVIRADGKSARLEPADGGGNTASARVALCGLGPHPSLADGPHSPDGDFKGSPEYRLAMAGVVVRRARAAAGATQL